MIKKCIAITAVVLFLASCVGLETETTFNPNGSGTMTFTYRLGNILSQMGEGESGVDLPFDEASLKESLQGAEGVVLKSTKTWSDENDTYMSATVSFESIDTFYTQDEFDDMAASLTKEGGDFVYRQLISAGMGDEEPSAEELAEFEAGMEMMAPYFEGYEIKIILNTPSKIKDYTLGELSNGGKTLTFVMPMLDVQSMAEETYLEVRW